MRPKRFTLQLEKYPPDSRVPTGGYHPDFLLLTHSEYKVLIRLLQLDLWLVQR